MSFKALLFSISIACLSGLFAGYQSTTGSVLRPPNYGSTTSAPVSDEGQKKILVFYTVRKGATLRNITERFFNKILNEGLGGHLDYYGEDIDVMRFSEPEYQSALHDFLRRKYKGYSFDLVMTVGGTAFDFVERFGDDLFPGIPVVFFGAGNRRVEDLRLKPNYTGVVERLDLRGTLDLALKLQPGVRQVFVVSGVSAYDKAYENLLRQQAHGLEDRLAITYLGGLSLKDILNRVANLPEDSCVYFLTVAEDGAGNKFFPQDTLKKVSSVSNVPIYTWNTGYMDEEIFGGSLMDVDGMAIQTAELALRVLHGEKPESISMVRGKPNVETINWRQLGRWGISEDKLPPGGIVLYREPSLWQRYSQWVIAALVVIGVQASLIAFLLLERNKRQRATEELRLSEERFSKAFRASPHAIAISRQSDLRIIEVNESWEELFGYTSEEAHERTPAELGLFLGEDDRQHQRRINSNDHSIRNLQLALRAKTGELRQTSISAETIRIGSDTCFISHFHDITERKKAEEALQMLTARLLQLQDEERRRIARELHDVTAQNLFTITINLAGLLQDSFRPSDVMRILTECRALGEQSLKEIRTLSYLLHPPMLDHAGLVFALEWYIDGFIKRSGIYIGLAAAPDLGRLPADVETALFRVVQECLTNIHRHSGSPSAEIRLERRGGQVFLEVEDRGRGMPAKHTLTDAEDFLSLGVGIAGMRQRLAQLGGDLEIKSSDRGTIVTAVVPFVEGAEDDSYSVSGRPRRDEERATLDA